MNSTIAIILVVLGLLVGVLNITDKETKNFLMSGTVLVLMSYLGTAATSQIMWLGDILNAMMLIFVPATIIVALKSVFGMASK